MNAIHALSQLSYAPAILSAFDGAAAARQRSRRSRSVNEGYTTPAWSGERVQGISQVMRKQHPMGEQPSDPAAQRPADPSTDPISADLTTAEILARTPAGKPGRPRRKESAKKLGVLRCRTRHSRPVSLRSQQDPAPHRAQEIAVARRAVAGDPEAMQELVKRNLRFVISVAKKYQNRGMALVDLIGEGNLGLLTAARKFDPDHGVKFISYAVWWIRQAILAAMARQGRTVRVPLNRTADLSRIVRSAENLRQELDREPTAGGNRHRHWALGGCGAGARRAQYRRGAARCPARCRGRPRRSSIASWPTRQSEPETQVMDQFLTEEIDRALRHAAAARRQGAAPLLRARRRAGAHPGGDRRPVRRHPGAGPAAPRPGPQAASGGRDGPGAGELRRVMPSLYTLSSLRVSFPP